MIGAGYGRADVLAMTPREIAAAVHLSSRRRTRDAADRLLLGALAAQGDKKAIEQALSDLKSET